MNYRTSKAVKISGYVLLDALIGVSLLSIVIVSSLYVFSQNIMMIEEIKKHTVAVCLAQGKMEEFTAQSNFTETAGGDFLPDYTDYTWASESSYIQKTNFYNLVNVKLTVYWKVRENQRNLVLETKIIEKK